MLEKEIMHNHYLFARVLHTAPFYKLGAREAFAPKMLRFDELAL
jgi:hypothetical protein